MPGWPRCDIQQGIFHKAATVGALARLRWGDAKQGIDLYTRDKGRLEEGTVVRWVLSGEHVQLHVAPAQGLNLVSGQLRSLRILGEIATLDCQPHDLPHATVHLDVTTRFARRLGLQSGATVFLEIDPQAIHIMPVKRALEDSVG